MRGVPVDSPSPQTAGQEARSAVRAAAASLGLTVAEEDLDAVAAHLGVLRAFAAGLGDPGPEPAAVFVP